MTRLLIACVGLCACTSYHDVKLGSLPAARDAAVLDASTDARPEAENDDEEGDEQQQQGEHETP